MASAMTDLNSYFFFRPALLSGSSVTISLLHFLMFGAGLGIELHELLLGADQLVQQFRAVETFGLVEPRFELRGLLLGLVDFAELGDETVDLLDGWAVRRGFLGLLERGQDVGELPFR